MNYNIFKGELCDFMESTADAGDAELQVWSLDRKDTLEKEIATHSSILASKIPWTEEPGRLQSVGSQRVGHDWARLQKECDYIA